MPLRFYVKSVTYDKFRVTKTAIWTIFEALNFIFVCSCLLWQIFKVTKIKIQRYKICRKFQEWKNEVYTRLNSKMVVLITWQPCDLRALEKQVRPWDDHHFAAARVPPGLSSLEPPQKTVRVFNKMAKKQLLIEFWNKTEKK